MFSTPTKTKKNISPLPAGLHTVSMQAGFRAGAKPPTSCFCGSTTHTFGENFFEMKSTWEAPYKFNGKELDSETGLYYYGARYYSPELGIWGSVDPLADKYPHQSNYMYCSGRPLNVIDPDGINQILMMPKVSLAILINIFFSLFKVEVEGFLEVGAGARLVA